MTKFNVLQKSDVDISTKKIFFFDIFFLIVSLTISNVVYRSANMKPSSSFHNA